MNAEILSVGTELLLGQIVDTNASYLAGRLPALGIDLYWISQVGDNRGRMAELLRRGLGRSDVIIVTGGLGPTVDDVTREAIADVMGEKMEVQPDLLSRLEQLFTSRGFAMTPNNLKQATLIPSAKAIDNAIGTAPGWWVEKDGHIIVAMPGVPAEMHVMWEQQVEPRLRERAGGLVIVSRTIRTVGIGESRLEEMIKPLFSLTNPTLAPYAKLDGVQVRITAKAASMDEARALIAPVETEVRQMLGDYVVYGVDDETLPGVVGKLLREGCVAVATMESCTGGGVSDALTDVPGSSEYFVGGVVAYSRAAKQQHGVPEAVLDRHGTVAPETAAAMAEAARDHFGADLGLATTGVAGPEPAEGVPVGTVHYAVAGPLGVRTQTMTFASTRKVVKQRATILALDLLRRYLLDLAGRRGEPKGELRR